MYTIYVFLNNLLLTPGIIEHSNCFYVSKGNTLPVVQVADEQTCGEFLHLP
jgi:hypothetical protein